MAKLRLLIEVFSNSRTLSNIAWFWSIHCRPAGFHSTPSASSAVATKAPPRPTVRAPAYSLSHEPGDPPDAVWPSAAAGRMHAAKVAATSVLKLFFMASPPASADDRDLAAHHVHRLARTLGLDQHDVAAARDHVAGPVAPVPLPGVEPAHSARGAAVEVDLAHQRAGLAEDADLDRGLIVQLVRERRALLRRVTRVREIGHRAAGRVGIHQRDRDREIAREAAGARAHDLALRLARGLQVGARAPVRAGHDVDRGERAGAGDQREAHRLIGDAVVELVG